MQCSHSNETSNENTSKKKITTILLNGLKNGLNTTWILTKVIVPVYFFITFLKYTGLLEWISIIFRPVMGIFGLPGEAAIVLVLGNFLNLYAAIGAASSITLTVKQITIIAIMLSFSHSLFMETAVAKKAGVNGTVIVLIRIALAVLSGIGLNILM